MTLSYIKKSKKLYIAIILAIIPIALVISLAIKGINDHNKYKDFLYAFDSSFSLSLHGNSLKAEYNDETTRLTEKNADSMYNMLLGAGYIYFNEEIPESSKVIHLDFGTGDEMYISAENDNAPKTCLVINYHRLDGYEFTYVTKTDFYFYNFARLVSEKHGNPLWEDSVETVKGRHNS